VGFLDYAWSVSTQKDNQKVKILQDEKLDQPTLEADDFGLTIKLPPVNTTPQGQFNYLGQRFPANTQGKNRIGRLFRASILHLTTHTLMPLPKEQAAPVSSDPITCAFAKGLFKDEYVNTYLEAKHPDKLVDIAYANVLAYQKIKRSQRIFASSTRVMTALLTKVNVGSVKGELASDEDKAVNGIYAELKTLKAPFVSSIAGEQINLSELFDAKVKKITALLEPFGPFLEAPSMRHTEQIGRCSIYTEAEMPTDDLELIFFQTLKTLGGAAPEAENIEQCWRPEQEAEALQAFNLIFTKGTPRKNPWQNQPLRVFDAVQVSELPRGRLYSVFEG
jgi:hypothetical protein